MTTLTGKPMKYATALCTIFSAIAITATFAFRPHHSAIVADNSYQTTGETALANSDTVIAAHATKVVASTVPANTDNWQTVNTKTRDTLSRIFTRMHLSHADLHKILKAPAAKTYFAEIRPNQKLYFDFNNQHQLEKIKYDADDATLLVARNNNSFDAIVAKKPITTDLLFKGGSIQHSLTSAVREVGGTHTMSAELATIFKNRVNLAHLSPGDRFDILYQEYYVNGKKDHPGQIMAAEIVHKGTAYDAFRFTDNHNHSGYYSPDGSEMDVSPQSLFLSAPLKYTRIGSGFTYHRLDPVIHLVHAHLGVDFDAPRGTPIKSIGDGKVISCGSERGYGNAIVIAYGKEYKALYGHLAKFAKSLHANEYVKKGQVIGYVGSTGWATGPHLHFGVFVNGIAKDPLKIKFPVAHPTIPRAYLAAFHARTHVLLAQLKLYEAPEFADNRSLKNNDG